MKLLGYFVGQTMAASENRAVPELVQEVRSPLVTFLLFEWCIFAPLSLDRRVDTPRDIMTTLSSGNRPTMV